MMAWRYAACLTAGVLLCDASLTSHPCKAADLYGSEPPNINEYLERLVKSYPDTIAGRDGEFLVLRNGAKYPISDRRNDKTFQQLLENPDIGDMFYAPYPAGAPLKQPARDIDPGRVRFEPLFNAMYGDCNKGEVEKNLRSVDWLPKHHGGVVRITKVNGVDKALQAVSTELDNLPNEFTKYLIPSSGTYNCRKISGSSAKSMHAYAAAIDLNTQFSNYWRWAAQNGREIKWENKIPTEVVRIFEKHGFIWGGYWYHYDTMHFEYRPELFLSTASDR
jgi:hypothetical protein